MSTLSVSPKAELTALKHPWSRSISVGRAYELLRTDLQEHLLFLKKDFGYRYIRFHASFHDDVNVVQRLPNGKIVYRWTQLDHIYDFLVNAGFYPIVEINPMPKALASGDTEFFWYKMNITPPESYEQWGAFIGAVTAHFVERYGIETVKKWYFEVWNEPNLRDSFWDGTQEEYFALYKATVTQIKALCPDFKVGGPAGAGNGWNLPMARYCRDNNVPIDFISYHAYPVGEADSPNGVGMEMVHHMRSTKEQLAEEGFGDLEILMTEWNTQVQNENKKVQWVGNEGVNKLSAGSLVCHLVNQTDDFVDMFTWWVVSDVFEEGGPQVEPYGRRYQYYGMLTIDGVPKSSFHAFHFLNRMRGPRYKVNVDNGGRVMRDALVTDETVATRCLLWNLVFPFEKESEPWSVNIELPLPASLKGNKHVRVSIAHVKEGQGSAYEYWKQMGSPANLTRIEQEVLSARAQPAYSSAMYPVSGDKISTKLTLASNEFAFIEISGETASDSSELDGSSNALNQALDVADLD